MVEYDIWKEKFEREIGFKSSIILHGNVNDLILSHDCLNYVFIINEIISLLKKKGFKNIFKWDSVEGIDYDVSNNIDDIIIDSKDDNVQGEENNEEDEYDVGEVLTSRKSYKEVSEFFPKMLSVVKEIRNKAAFILDYSDYLFGNANSLSELERNYLITFNKALEKSTSYNLLNSNFNQIGNIIILITKNEALIPPSYYLNNPLVNSINIPVPGRKEREKFIKENKTLLRISQNIDESSIRDNFVDSLDGFTLKEIAQLFKLSRQLKDERISYEKLINLYKYGEKVSPWEELSREKLSNLENKLKERVKGQDEAINKVKDVVFRAYTGFSGLQHSTKQKKPKGTLFFVGPTGVGKTELAKSLAEFVFGDENACIRFDMSEYNHEHSDQKLIGAPPGYVGYEAGGQLTNAIKEKPFSVLLFDEIEKAHGRILDKFLQILEDGRLTDGKGETIYFSETIIIFTSNIGASEINYQEDKLELRKEFMSKVQKHFVEKLGRPELLNRIGDNIVAFNFIDSNDVLIEIGKSKFKPIKNFLNERYKLNVEFENENAAFLAISQKAGKQNGGRGLLNVIESTIVNPLSEFIFENLDNLKGRKLIITQPRAILPIFDFELE